MDEVEKAKLKLELRNLRKKRAVASHSVNFYLLLIIVILMVALASAAVYFLWRHGAVIEENEEFVGAKSATDIRLNECRANLGELTQNLQSLSEELNISSSSKEGLNKLYSDLSNLKASLEANLTNTKSGLNACNLQIVEARNDRDEAIGQLNIEINKYNQLMLSTNKSVTNLNNKIDSLELQLSAVKGDLKDIRDCIEDNNCTSCDDL